MTFYQRQQVLIEEAKNKIFKVLFQKHGFDNGPYFEVELDCLRDSELWVSCEYNGCLCARQVLSNGDITYPDLTNEQIIVLGDMMDDIDADITKHIHEGVPLVEFFPKIRFVNH